MFVFHLYIYVIIIRFIEQGICICVIRITLLLLFFYDQMINKLYSFTYLFIYSLYFSRLKSLKTCINVYTSLQMQF